MHHNHLYLLQCIYFMYKSEKHKKLFNCENSCICGVQWNEYGNEMVLTKLLICFECISYMNVCKKSQKLGRIWMRQRKLQRFSTLIKTRNRMGSRETSFDAVWWWKRDYRFPLDIWMNRNHVRMLCIMYNWMNAFIVYTIHTHRVHTVYHSRSVLLLDC